MSPFEVAKQRSVFAAGIVGICVAVYTKLSELKEDPFYLMSIAKSTLVVSGMLAFIFLLGQAASYKFKQNDSIGPLRFYPNTFNWCYDWSIDIFGSSLISGLTLAIQKYLENNYHFEPWKAATLAFFGSFLVGVTYLLIVNKPWKKSSK